MSVSSRKQRCAVAQEVQISNSKDLREIPKGHPQRGAKLFYLVWPPDQIETFGPSFSTANESVPKIIINNTVNLFLKLQSTFWQFQTTTVSVLFDEIAFVLFYLKKSIYFLALEMARPENQQYANCIGTLSFPILPFPVLHFPVPHFSTRTS